MGVLTGCVVEEGLERENDPRAGSLAGSEVIIAGDDVAGDDVAGDDVAGDDVAGDDVAGDDVAGDDVEAGVTAGTVSGGAEAGTINGGTTAGSTLCEPEPCPPGTALNNDCICELLDCACETLYDPVCGADNITYGNECELGCARQEFAYYGECGDPSYYECFEPNPNVDYISDDIYQCEYIDYECPESSEYYYDECGCGCYERDCDVECEDAPEEPVCAPNGERFSSACHASCEGRFEYRPCEMECMCDESYEPQCGLDGNTYSNSCLRECVGVPLSYEGECNNDSVWICEEDEAWESCELACEEANSCFVDQCSADELTQINQACTSICSETSPDLICSFGSCFDLPLLFRDFGFDFELSLEGIECFNQICPDEFNGAEYIGYDQDTCRLIGEIDCGDRESFSSACGCGCIGDACMSDDQARYVSYDSEVCERITIACPEGSAVFSDACGCGCAF